MKKIAFTLALCLSACSASAVQYVAPEGKDAASIANDNQRCRLFAAELVASRASVPAYGITIGASAREEQELYVDCLKARGYRPAGTDLPPGALQ